MSPYSQHAAKWNQCQQCFLHAQRKKVCLARGTVPAPILLVGEAPGASEDVIGKPFVGPAGRLLDVILQRAWEGKHRYCVSNLVCCIPKLPPPTVVNLHNDEYDVRIDRESAWGNPFHVGKDGSRDMVIRKYAAWFPQQLNLLEKLPTLAGKRLGCHCAPLLCHGNVIAEFYRQLVGTGKIAEPPLEAITACAPRLAELQAMVSPKLTVAVGKLAGKHVAAQVEITHPAAILRMDVSQQGLAIQRAVVTLADAAEDLL